MRNINHSTRLKNFRNRVKKGFTKNNIESKLSNYSGNIENKHDNITRKFNEHPYKKRMNQRFIHHKEKYNKVVKKYTGGKSSLKGKVVLFILSILIIFLTHTGVKNAKLAVKNPKDDNSRKTILRNQKMLEFSYGLGWGFLVYILLSFVMNPVKIILVSLLIGAMSGMTIHSFEEIKDDKNCGKDKIQDTYALMYAFLGASVGLFSASIIIFGLGKMNVTSIITMQILAFLVATIIIFLCSVDINTINNMKGKGIGKTTTIIVLILAILIILADIGSLVLG